MGNMLILSCFYLFMAWYLAQVFGQSLGQNKRAWFFLLPEFWGAQSEDDRKLAELKRMHEGNGNAAGALLSSDRLVHEQYLSLRNQELRTYKLSKSYKQSSALKEVSLKMESGGCFALLGHNGAGQ
jgi:ABC-type transport system involved in cytochrome bd biosynthesis fused ATPase/permease subunit